MFWSKPIGRFTGVVLVAVVLPVTMFALYATILIAHNPIGFYIRTSDCPGFSKFTLPDECLAHVGDLIIGEEGDGKIDFVWHATQREQNICARAISHMPYLKSLQRHFRRSFQGRHLAGMLG